MTNIQQDEKLRRFLKTVSETNSFYKNIIAEYGITDPTDITRYPILTRKMLQENRYNMFSDGYKAKYYNQQLRRQSSSGTSGVPVSVYWDMSDYWRSMLPLWRKRMQWYDIAPNARVAMFTLTSYSANDYNIVQATQGKSNTLNLRRANLSTHSKLLETVAALKEFSPVWIYIQPHMLNILADFYRESGDLPPRSIRYVESVGELLTQKTRTTAESLFDAPVANLYGSEEMNGIAYECPYHHMHILDDNVFVEAFDLPSESHEKVERTIITNLNNQAMPLIRYEQGDFFKANTLSGGCSCGYGDNVIELVCGRERDSFIVDGYSVNSYLLREVIEDVNNQFRDPIISFDFEYYKIDHKLNCRIVVSSEKRKWSSDICEAVRKAYKGRIPAILQFEVNIADPDTLLTRGNGKPQILRIKEE